MVFFDNPYGANNPKTAPREYVPISIICISSLFAARRAAAPGSAQNTFVPGEDVLDGIKVDKLGNLYVSGPGGLWVISAEGKHLGNQNSQYIHNMA